MSAPESPCPFCETMIEPESDACCNELRLAREVLSLKQKPKKARAEIRRLRAMWERER